MHLPYAWIVPMCVAGALCGHIVLTRALLMRGSPSSRKLEVRSDTAPAKFGSAILIGSTSIDFTRSQLRTRLERRQRE